MHGVMMQLELWSWCLQKYFYESAARMALFNIHLQPTKSSSVSHLTILGWVWWNHGEKIPNNFKIFLFASIASNVNTFYMIVLRFEYMHISICIQLLLYMYVSYFICGYTFDKM